MAEGADAPTSTRSLWRKSMNGTRKMLLSLFAVLLLTFGVLACKSTSSTTTSTTSASSNTTGDMNTAGLNNSTGAYTGGSQEMNKAPEVSAEANAQARPGARENTQAVTPDNSYSGTGQTLVTSNGQRAAVNTKSTTTYSTPTVVQSAPTVVAPNTTATETTTVTTPVTTAEITTPSTSSSTTTT